MSQSSLQLAAAAAAAVAFTRKDSENKSSNSNGGFESSFQSGLDLSEFETKSSTTKCASAQWLDKKRTDAQDDARMDELVQARSKNLSHSLSLQPSENNCHDVASTICSMHTGDEHGGRHSHSLSKMKPRMTTTANRKAYANNKALIKAQQRKQMANKKTKKSKHLKTGWKGKPLGGKAK